MSTSSGMTLVMAWVLLADDAKKKSEAYISNRPYTPEEYLAHLSPLEWEHVTLTGVYRWDLGGPQAAIGADGLRPLRGLG